MKLMLSKTSVVVAACLLIVTLSLVSIIRTGCRRPPVAYTLTLDQCTAEMLAHEALKLLGDRGDVVVIMHMSTPLKYVRNDPQLRAFTKVLATRPNVHLLAVEGAIQQDLMAPGARPGPQDLMPASGALQGFPEKLFWDVVKRYPGVQVVVSFVGVPMIDKQDARIDQATFPKIVAVNPTLAPWRELLQAGLVNTVLLPRTDRTESQLPHQVDCDALLRARYTIVTRENMNSVNDQGAPTQ
jgi:hypothetical protein